MSVVLSYQREGREFLRAVKRMQLAGTASRSAILVDRKTADATLGRACLPALSRLLPDPATSPDGM